MTSRLFLFFVVGTFFIGCQERSYRFEDYLDSSLKESIMSQLIPRIEKRYTGLDMARQGSMDAMWLDSCYIHALTKRKNDERYYFLYIKKDVITERDDARAVIGSFRLDKDNKVLTSVYQDYISFRTRTLLAEDNGMVYLKRHVEGDTLEEYLNRPGMIQWPNGDVWFNYEVEKWEW